MAFADVGQGGLPSLAVAQTYALLWWGLVRLHDDVLDVGPDPLSHMEHLWPLGCSIEPARPHDSDQWSALRLPRCARHHPLAQPADLRPQRSPAGDRSLRTKPSAAMQITA